jgi:SET and MYND domain-containing protein
MRRQTEMELKMFKQNEEVYRTMREAALKKQPAKAMAENSSTEEKIEDVSRKQ